MNTLPRVSHGTGLLVLALVAIACDGGPAPAGAVAAYVGAAACAECHVAETQAWRGSHHDLAMQEATPDAVLGDFSGATFAHRGVTSTFSQSGEQFFVRTEGPDGALTDYEVIYTFGVTPLQQYLISFPGGRLQVLGIAWDSRPTAEGGQRWFHLYPDADTGPESALHWTRPAQNWNTVCAECHSTNLQKGYDAETLTFTTTWSEVDVSCESCHGPGSIHVDVAGSVGALAASRPAPEPESGWGFSRSMAQPARAWSPAAGAATASLTTTEPSTLVEDCARCHARRATISDASGASLHDTYRVSLLREDLYYPDGQIREEVYVYGSFVQSKMYAAGVTCADCHEPHSLGLRATGNTLCGQCHSAATFDTSAHHFHEEGSTGAQCVECHMPETTYMVVDPRRDHGIRVPRPDLTEATGAPNACSRCHQDQTVAWASEAFESWYGPASTRGTHHSEVIAAARAGNPNALGPLTVLAADRSAAPIVRATAASLLAGYPSNEAVQAIRTGLNDPDPLVRTGAAEALAGFPENVVSSLLFPLLSDPVRAVRLQATRALAASLANPANEAQAAALSTALDEYEQSNLVNADHSGAWVALGDLYGARGSVDEARRAYEQAIATDPTDRVAHLNLADMHRATGRDDLAEQVLLAALDAQPDAAEVQHALGLLRVREGTPESALPLLRSAATTQPENARFQYVLGVALASNGEVDQGIEVLVTALSVSPFDRDVLTALATYSRDSGDTDGAILYAERLVEVTPGDPGTIELLRQLRAGSR